MEFGLLQGLANAGAGRIPIQDAEALCEQVLLDLIVVGVRLCAQPDIEGVLFAGLLEEVVRIAGDEGSFMRWPGGKPVEGADNLEFDRYVEP